MSLSEQFIGWQCRIRQHAMRTKGGVPPQGIKASVKINGSFAGQINTVINKRDPEKVIAEFKFMVQKTVDPLKRLENALKYLSEYYYQYPKEFDDMFTALFALDSDISEQLVSAETVELTFFQANQKYVLIANAVNCAVDSPPYQATYWHNHLFNPNMPGVVNVLGFEIDWDSSFSEQG